MGSTGKMRCRACNRILEDNELTRKDKDGDFRDMCSTCLFASASAGLDTQEIMEYYQNELFTNDDDYGTLF
jgi:hypothetical protein